MDKARGPLSSIGASPVSSEVTMDARSFTGPAGSSLSSREERGVVGASEVAEGKTREP